MTDPDLDPQQPTSPTDVVRRQMRRLRDAHGWIARELAERCEAAGAGHLDRNVIANTESGRRRSISVDELVVLAYVLDVSPVHLLAPAPDALYRIGATATVGADLARSWIRGEVEAPGQDARRWLDAEGVIQQRVAPTAYTARPATPALLAGLAAHVREHARRAAIEANDAMTGLSKILLGLTALDPLTPVLVEVVRRAVEYADYVTDSPERSAELGGVDARYGRLVAAVNEARPGIEALLRDAEPSA